MTLFITIIAFLLIFSVLILVHEFGHFYMAKRSDIKVEEFGFGLPPRIWGKKRGETLYSLNWIPFGGFVRMLGEDLRHANAKKSNRSFIRKTLWQRTQVVLAGVIMNFLFAWLLLSIGFMVGMQPLIVTPDDFLQAIRNQQVDLSFDSSQKGDVFHLPQLIIESVEEAVSGEFLFKPGDQLYSIEGTRVLDASDLYALWNFRGDDALHLEIVRDGVIHPIAFDYPHPHRTRIVTVLPDSPAEKAGLLDGDQVITVNGESIWTPEAVIEIVTSDPIETVEYTIQRDGALMNFVMLKNESGLVGVMLGLIHDPSNMPFTFYEGAAKATIHSIGVEQYPFYEAPFRALSEIKRIGGYTVISIGGVFRDILFKGEVPEGVAGPVGIAQMTGIYVQEGFVAVLRFTALLSLSLAVINLFPFPALDGGRFLFILIEAVRGKPVDSKLEATIHTIGFFILLSVIFLVTFNDIQRLFT